MLAVYLTDNNGFAIVIALAAGVLSSASPCTLAILPASVAYVGGASGAGRISAAKSAFVFWIGLTLSLTVLGVLAGHLGMFFSGWGRWWYIALGIGFAILGFNMMGWLKLLPDNCSLQVKRYGLGGALLAGMIGGIASSPCATPALAAILALVAIKGNWLYGATMLLAYSFGRGVLLFVAGLFAGQISRILVSDNVGRIVNWLRRIFGMLLLLVSLGLFYIAF